MLEKTMVYRDAGYKYVRDMTASALNFIGCNVVNAYDRRVMDWHHREVCGADIVSIAIDREKNVAEVEYFCSTAEQIVKKIWFERTDACLDYTPVRWTECGIGHGCCFGEWHPWYGEAKKVGLPMV